MSQVSSSSNLTFIAARDNMSLFAQAPYPGRFIVQGMNEDGTHAVQIYGIMGRSENSRNRVFGAEGGRLFTRAADPLKMRDPNNLVIYNAMQESIGFGLYVVSNGHQTDVVLNYLRKGNDLRFALSRFLYEPDSPTHTPRITGVCQIRNASPEFELAMLRKSPFDNSCERFFWGYETIDNGFGVCLSTYQWEYDQSLPSFSGEPYLMPIIGNSIHIIAGHYWNALNDDNRISLAVKAINLATGQSEITIINKYRVVA